MSEEARKDQAGDRDNTLEGVHLMTARAARFLLLFLCSAEALGKHKERSDEWETQRKGRFNDIQEFYVSKS